MKRGAKVLVMRRAPIIGRLDSPLRVTVAYRAYSVDEALRWARSELQLVRAVDSRRRSSFWLEAPGCSARMVK